MSTTSTSAPADNAGDSPQHALSIDAISKSFSGTTGPFVLQNVTVTGAEGEFIAIVGPSGCGKTTLLRIIQGLEHATSGSVHTGSYQNGTDPRMSYVFQRPSLLPWYTVRRNVAFGLTLASGRGLHRNRGERSQAVEELLELTGLSQCADYYPDQISGGMQQRVNVARALAIRPDVILLDEPFSALDALTREQLQVDVGSMLSRLGTTAVLVTHDIREAVFMTDRVIIMSSGPGQIREVVPIKHARPRSPEFQHSPELAKIERQIWNRLHD